MQSSKVISLQILFLALGLAAWGLQGNWFHKNEKLANELVWSGPQKLQLVASPREHNPLHLKRSPFGRTIALAMRGPVDVYWHRGEPHSHDGHGHSHDGHGHSHDGHGHSHDGHGHSHGGHGHSHDGHGHSHGGHGIEIPPGEDSDLDYLASLLAGGGEGPARQEDHHDNEDPHPGRGEESGPAAKRSKGLRPYLLDKLQEMQTSYNSKTNRNQESPRHKAYIMGEMEKKLATGYELDPSNLGAYGAYFLFKSEALARVEGHDGEQELIMDRRREAHQLAHKTLQYCLELPGEPPAMITGASATQDCLQMLAEHPDPDVKLARWYLRRLDMFLEQYAVLRQAMMANKTWENFPSPRRAEMEKAYSLVKSLQKANIQFWDGRLSRNAAPAPKVPDSGG